MSSLLFLFLNSTEWTPLLVCSAFVPLNDERPRRKGLKWLVMIRKCPNNAAECCLSSHPYVGLNDTQLSMLPQDRSPNRSDCRYLTVEAIVTTSAVRSVLDRAPSMLRYCSLLKLNSVQTQLNVVLHTNSYKCTKLTRQYLFQSL